MENYENYERYTSIAGALKYIECLSGPWDENSSDAYDIKFTDEDRWIFEEVQDTYSYNKDVKKEYYEPNWELMLKYAGKKSANIKKAVGIMVGDSECNAYQNDYMEKVEARMEREKEKEGAIRRYKNEQAAMRLKKQL